jgi:hypothetical protein
VITAGWCVSGWSPFQFLFVDGSPFTGESHAVQSGDPLWGKRRDMTVRGQSPFTLTRPPRPRARCSPTIGTK